MANAKLNVPLPSNGLVVDRPAEYVDQRAAVNIKNMEYNRSVIRKRSGTSSVGASLGERVMRLFELQVGASTRLFRVGLTKVEVLDKATNTWSSVTTTPLTGAVADVFAVAYPLLAGVKTVCYSNGLDPIRKCGISGNDGALGGSPPKARFMQAFGPYLFLGYVIDGGNNFYSRIQWCDTGDPESWTPASSSNAGSVDLVEDPDDITGMGVFGNLLTVHKRTAIYVGQLVTTAGVIRFSRKPTGVGTVAGATIQNIPSGEQIFLGPDGIHIFNGLTAPLIDSPIQDELREEMNPAYLYKAQSVYIAELDEYWVLVATGSDTEPQTVYKYNYRTRQIYKDSRANCCAVGLFLNTTEALWSDFSNTWDTEVTLWNSVSNLSLNPVVMLGDASGKTAKRAIGSSNDIDVAVEGVWDTKDFTVTDFGGTDIDRLMRWKGLKVWAKGNAMQVFYSVDGGTSWLLAKTATLSSDYPTDAMPLVVYFDKVNSRMRFRFYNNSLDSSFTIKKYQIAAVQREAVK